MLIAVQPATADESAYRQQVVSEFEQRRLANKRAWREANKARVREYYADWYSLNWEKRSARLKAARAAVHKEKPARPLSKKQLRDLLKQRILARQGGCCAICKATSPGTKHGWHLDHCHATGKTGGVLCLRCNTTLGRVQDDIGLLQRMVGYLEGNR